MSLRISISLIATALTAATATAILAAATWGSDSPPAPSPSPDPSAYAKVAAVASGQAAPFGVLRRPARANDPIDTDATGPFGANLRLAHVVSRDGLTAWIVPANQHLCIRSIDIRYPVWGCTSTSDAADGHLVMTLRDQAYKATAIFALVPDGVSSATLRGPETAPTSVPVQDNLAIVANTDASTLTYTDRDGHSQSVLVP